MPSQKKISLDEQLIRNANELTEKACGDEVPYEVAVRGGYCPASFWAGGLNRSADAARMFLVRGVGKKELESVKSRRPGARVAEKFFRVSRKKDKD
jgi:hypothetical protein